MGRSREHDLAIRRSKCAAAMFRFQSPRKRSQVQVQVSHVRHACPAPRSAKRESADLGNDAGMLDREQPRPAGRNARDPDRAGSGCRGIAQPAAFDATRPSGNRYPVPASAPRCTPRSRPGFPARKSCPIRQTFDNRVLVFIGQNRRLFNECNQPEKDLAFNHSVLLCVQLPQFRWSLPDEVRARDDGVPFRRSRQSRDVIRLNIKVPRIGFSFRRIYEQK